MRTVDNNTVTFESARLPGHYLDVMLHGGPLSRRRITLRIKKLEPSDLNHTWAHFKLDGHMGHLAQLPS
eukprot:12895218-Prorocentrum_lima.AAC.1